MIEGRQPRRGELELARQVATRYGTSWERLPAKQERERAALLAKLDAARTRVRELEQEQS